MLNQELQKNGLTFDNIDFRESNDKNKS